MIEIKIIGDGKTLHRSLCKETEAFIRQHNIDAIVIREENLITILQMNLSSLPALMIDGQIITQGIHSFENTLPFFQNFITTPPSE